MFACDMHTLQALTVGSGKKPANVSLDELSVNDSYQHIDYNEGFEVQLMSKFLDMAHKPAPHTVPSSLLRGMLSGEEAVTQQSFAVEPEFISTTQRHRHVVHTPASQQSSSMNGVHTSRKMPFRAEPQQ